MKILIVDDEWAAIQELERVISNVLVSPELYRAANADETLRQIRENRFDVIFLDIQLPGIDGLTLAGEIQKMDPRANIVIQTANPQFALDAYELYVCDFIVKPVTADDIRKTMKHLRYPLETEFRKLRVQCFGNFEVYWNNEPLQFKRLKTKEMFAYLIDRGCALCTSDEILSVLWEEGDASESSKSYVRVLISDLRDTLLSIGMESMLIRRRNQVALNKDMIDCDYYSYIDGDKESRESFHGEYMNQYSWASETEGLLYFQ